MPSVKEHLWIDPIYKVDRTRAYQHAIPQILWLSNGPAYAVGKTDVRRFFPDIDRILDIISNTLDVCPKVFTLVLGGSFCRQTNKVGKNGIYTDKHIIFITHRCL